jgi:hypothetical protein
VPGRRPRRCRPGRPRHPDGLALDRDAALALDVHPVEVLRPHARSSTTPVSCSIRSASVDLPWSMWAMMQKLRMIAGRYWTWPVEGAAWLDTVTLLALARADADGTIDADALLAERALTRGVPADDVDSWLALLAGYFLKSALDPVPVAAPHLRRHQQQVGDVLWDWLAARRGWH